MTSSLPSSKPKQYIQGWVEFYKLRFKVNKSVLIPRPETELLVDEILSFLQTTNYQPPATILDLGTGSGNIAISVAKNAPKINMIATDISLKALKVAKQNAKLHGVEDSIAFVQSNLLSDLNCNLYPETCNLVIVTNLPYIPSARIPYLDSSVKDFEPKIALDGGKDGFNLYRKLFSQISTLQPARQCQSLAGGPLGFKLKLLIGEIDYTHRELAVNEALKFFPTAQVEVKTDLTQKQRILKITF